MIGITLIIYKYVGIVSMNLQHCIIIRPIDMVQLLNRLTNARYYMSCSVAFGVSERESNYSLA